LNFTDSVEELADHVAAMVDKIRRLSAPVLIEDPGEKHREEKNGAYKGLV
jgi:hypothetical protein